MSNISELKTGEIDLVDEYEHAVEIRRQIAKIKDPIIRADFELRLFALLQLNFELPVSELEEDD